MSEAPKCALAIAHELMQAAHKLAPEGDCVAALGFAFAIAMAEYAWPAPVPIEDVLSLIDGVTRAANNHWCSLHGFSPGDPVGHA